MFFNKQKNEISIKIGDLGDSIQISNIENFLRNFVGTPLYQSPEMMANLAYNYKTDVW